MSKRSRAVLLFLLVALLLLGVAAAAYPAVSAWHNTRVRSTVEAEYQARLEAVPSGAVKEARAAAAAYNRALFSGALDLQRPEENGYFKELDLTGSGTMGYLRIPKIHVLLPILHGVGEHALERGAGHMSQSSLPVGGENTHCVLAGHTGTASSPMFTDLALLEEGDLFYLEVLGEQLTYRVSEISVVAPEDITKIQIRKGEDLVTLVTCTPYGVNSHRLLVTGRRVETPSQEALPQGGETAGDAGSLWMERYLSGIKTAALTAGGLLLPAAAVLCWKRRHRDG